MQCQTYFRGTVILVSFLTLKFIYLFMPRDNRTTKLGIL